MILGQVVGTVVATVKDPQLAGEKILLVQLMNAKREKIGRPLAAIEIVDAGVGDLVVLVRSREAALATYPTQPPVDLAIVGIVDSTASTENLDLELPFGESFFYMMICKVVGNVVSTVKHSAYAGRKLMIVRPMHLPGDTSDDDFLAIDGAQAGIGDTVLVCQEGNATRALVGNPNAPVRSSIVGVIDSVTLSD